MKSKWRLSCNIVNDRQMYIAYRLIDVKEIDRSGNREYIENSGAPYYRGGYTEDRALVERLIAQLNAELPAALAD